MRIGAKINTERTHRENEAQLYFLCPICGVNLSVLEEHRSSDRLGCYHCKKTLDNPLIYSYSDYYKLLK